MELVDRSGQRLRSLLIIGALVAALYIWAFGFKEHSAHLDFIAARLAQKQQAQAQPAKTPDQPPKTVAPAQMPSGLYPAFLQAQQTAAIEDYSIAATANGLEAKNAANGFNTRFTSSGVEFNGWQMRLSGLGWSGQTPAPIKDTAPVVKDNRVEYQRMGGFTEWYLNGPLGLEQGFTLSQPLADQPDTGWLSLELSLQGVTATPTGQDDWLVLNPTTGPALRYGKLYAYDANGTSLPIKLAVTPNGKSLRLLTNLQGARFPVMVDPFVQQQMLTASVGAANDYFGSSVALNSTGDVAIIGANGKTVGANNHQGVAYIFSRSGTVWTQQQVLSDTVSGAADDDFGSSVALNSTGDIALIGAYFKGFQNGEVYVFSRNGSIWNQQQILSGGGGWFGFSVTLNGAGDIALIGASQRQVGSNTEQGTAYVFSRSGTVWTQQQVLSDTVNGTDHDHFGWSVALNSVGNIALIGAYSKTAGPNYAQGTAYVFTQSGTVWSQQQVLTDSITGAVGDYFGAAVALNSTGDTALIGAPYKKINGNNLQGAAYIFSQNGIAWNQKQILTDTLTGATNDNFGGSVALSSAGNIALIGAYYNPLSANPHQGKAYIFSQESSVWSQQQVFSDTSTGGANDQFGWSVALNGTGNSALVGAYTKAVGVNNKQGAVYAFQFQPPSTNLNLASTPNPSTFGQSVTFTATVSPITATGTVTFTEGATTLGAGTLSGGLATFSTGSLTAGSHVISATYGGDSNFAFSSSSPVTQMVNKTSTTLNLTSAPNPSTFGQSVTFTATVSPITATGTVTFTEGLATLGTATLSGGSAIFSTTNLSVGSHVISATYGGDSDYSGSSDAVTQVVNCNPDHSLVTNISDDGTGSVCGTFSYALAQASSGVTITFMLTTSNTITFSGTLTPTVPSGVTIDGGGGAGIVLDGNGVGGDALRLEGNDTLINLTIKRFGGRELVTLGPGNKLIKVRIQQT